MPTQSVRVTMIGRYERALRWTLNWEGGFSNHPADKGGATMWGITQRTYDAYRASMGLAKMPVQNMAFSDCQAIYLKYWNESSAGAFAYPLALAVFDTAVNFGIGRAKMFLFEAFHGARLIGGSLKGLAREIGALPATEQAKLAAKIADIRIAYRHKRVKNDPTQAVFLRGWLRRDNALKAAASVTGGK